MWLLFKTPIFRKKKNGNLHLHPLLHSLKSAGYQLNVKNGADASPLVSDHNPLPHDGARPNSPASGSAGNYY